MSYVKCRGIGDLDVSSADSNIDCNGDYYRKKVLPTSFLIGFVTGVVIPVWICIILFRNQNQNKLNTTQCMKKYGILYMTYT